MRLRNNSGGRYAMMKSRKDLKDTFKRLNQQQKSQFVANWTQTGGADLGVCFSVQTDNMQARSGFSV